MGHKGVNSKLLKQYGDMTDGGRTYDRAGSSKNKMGLKHLLKITKHIIQEHHLHDEAAYTLFRKALTGKALESSILMEDNGGYSNLSDTEAPKIPTFQGYKNSDSVLG